MPIELLDIVPAASRLGENILWDDAQSCLWWTDIPAQHLTRYDPRTKSMQHFGTPERLCAFALTEDPDRLLAAFATGIGVCRPGDTHVEWLSRPDVCQTGQRLNDGRTDRQGRFWVGAMVEDGGDARAALYRFDPHRGLVPQIGGIAISNGLCWSPDGTIMYFADSMTRRIRRYDYDPKSGAMSNARDFAISKGNGGPDGGVADADGYVWSAQWGNAQVIRYTPDGKVDTVIGLPVSMPTCVGFAGTDMDLLVVTTARDGMGGDAREREPHAGDVFIFKTDVRGLTDARARL
jgi:L-arabinonolactonase